MNERPIGFYDLKVRTVSPVAKSVDFFNTLQDRLHTCVENILFQGDDRFTVFLEALPRNTDEPIFYKRDKGHTFNYVGDLTQRALLESRANERWGDIELPTDKDWANLTQIPIDETMVQVSSTVFQKIMSGLYSLDDVMKITSLKSYFEEIAPVNESIQDAEQQIIKKIFDINNDLFLSLPLIGFAEFDGMVYIIFKKEMLEHVEGATNEAMPRSVIWSLLRAFIVEYDGLFLDWDTVGDSGSKIASVYDFFYQTILKEEAYFLRESGPKNPKILKELKLQEYYKRHANYFYERLAQNDAIPWNLYQQYINQAVTSILIDSYAHNVSAHALSTLSWWFFRRAKQLDDQEVEWERLIEFLEEDPSINEKILAEFEKEIVQRRERKWAEEEKYKIKEAEEKGEEYEVKGEGGWRKPKERISVKDGGAVINYAGSLAKEIGYLLRFLTEKGAYWGGVTRDTNVGGKESSLYSILWYDFINNPFYLGTIAKTEDILRLNIRIVLYDDEIQENRADKSNYHKKTFKPENDRLFAWVDLSQARKDVEKVSLKGAHDEVLSPFVNINKKDFYYLREELKKIRVFFPGGVVGKHALYTMIENEIRNVKHYNTEELKPMQENGLTLVIGIQSCSLHNSKSKEIYRMSVWLDTPTRLTKDKRNIIQDKWQSLDGEIFNYTPTESFEAIRDRVIQGKPPRTSTYAPRLGGTYQDKICAGFLFNGHFSWVQKGDKNPERDNRTDTDRDRKYYPWVRPACSALREDQSDPYTHIDYKISNNNDFDHPDQLPERGYLKKIFYLWKGERLHDASSGKISTWDNPARFGLMNLKKEEEVLDARRKHGIVRIINKDLSAFHTEEERYIQAYKYWLHSFLGYPEFFAFSVSERQQPKFIIALDNRENNLHLLFQKRVKPESQLEYDFRTWMEGNEKKARECNLNIAHRTDGADVSEGMVMRYRSHGVLKVQFLPESKGQTVKAQDDAKMLELFELMTTKICIIDNRVHQRLRLEDKQVDYQAFLRDQLKMMVLPENTGVSKSAVQSEWFNLLSTEQQNYIKECHFLVMHLSFIESVLQKEQPSLRPNETSNVGLFLETQIQPLVGNRENFFFVVTTGRGRNEWWTALDKDQSEQTKKYAKMTLFRPIETILAAIENSIGMEDDIELKYRVTKILFGS